MTQGERKIFDEYNKIKKIKDELLKRKVDEFNEFLEEMKIYDDENSAYFIRSICYDEGTGKFWFSVEKEK